MEAKPSNQHIVVGYDFSDPARTTLSQALEIAARAPGHMLHILTVFDEKNNILNKSRMDYNDAAEVQDTLTRDVEAQLRQANHEQEIHFFVHARFGDPATEILRLAEEVGARIILVGSHGRTGIKRMLMGSVSERVVREARCPVLVAREREYQDVELLPMEERPEGATPEQAYVQPHRYSYSNQMMARQKSSWPWY